MSNERNNNKKNKSVVSKIIKVILIIFLVLVLILSGAAIGGYLYLKNELGTMNYVEIDKKEIEVNEGIEEKLEGYRTIALFGVDSRSNQLESNTRTDCIILAIVDQKNKEVKLVSVYRDSYLQITGYRTR